MPRPWRRWIAALLMVTLPLQAAVAAAGLCCLQRAAGEGLAEAAAASVRAEAPPCHASGGPQDAAVVAPIADDAGQSAAGASGDGECHACAACAMGVALPAGTGCAPGALPATALQALATLPAAERAPPPPEPPPRV